MRRTTNLTCAVSKNCLHCLLDDENDVIRMVCGRPKYTLFHICARAVRYGQKKEIAISLINFAISILITILTHTDMLYSHKCIQCEFEMYFQKKTN